MQNNTQENLENVAVSSNDETFQKAPTIHDASIIKRIPRFLHYYCYIKKIRVGQIANKARLSMDIVNKLLVEHSLDIPFEKYIKIVHAMGLKEYAQKLQSGVMTELFVGEYQKALTFNIEESLTIEEYICLLIKFCKVKLLKELLPFNDEKLKHVLREYAFHRNGDRQCRKMVEWASKKKVFPCANNIHSSAFEEFLRVLNRYYELYKLDLEVFAENAQVSINAVEKLFKEKSLDISIQEYINILNSLDYKAHTEKLRSHEIISFVLEKESDAQAENTSTRICPIFTMEEYICLLLVLENDEHIDEFFVFSNEDIRILRQERSKQRKPVNSMLLRAFYES